MPHTIFSFHHHVCHCKVGRTHETRKNESATSADLSFPLRPPPWNPPSLTPFLDAPTGFERPERSMLRFSKLRSKAEGGYSDVDCDVF